RALQITRKALLGLDQRNLFLQRTRDVTQLHILARLDAEQHLRYKPSERLGQALTEFRGELRQLRFESGANFAIVHWGWPPGGLDFSQKTVLPRISSPPTSQSRQATDLSRVRHSVLQILGRLLLYFQEFLPFFPAPGPSHASLRNTGECRT